MPPIERSLLTLCKTTIRPFRPSPSLFRKSPLPKSLHSPRVSPFSTTPFRRNSDQLSKPKGEDSITKENLFQNYPKLHIFVRRTTRILQIALGLQILNLVGEVGLQTYELHNGLERDPETWWAKHVLLQLWPKREETIMEIDPQEEFENEFKRAIKKGHGMSVRWYRDNQPLMQGEVEERFEEQGDEGLKDPIVDLFIGTDLEVE